MYQYDRQLYLDFIVDIIDQVHSLGLLVIDTIVPDTFELITDIFDTHNYMQFVNDLVDYTIVFPISVGIKLNIPLGSSNYHTINDLIEYFLEFIPAESMELGINTVGYSWELPYIPCVSEGNAISVFSIMELARNYSIPISFDERNQAAYLIFQDNNREYLMRFRDPRSFLMYMDIVNTYNLDGIGVWNTMSFITPLWHMVNANYYINKVEL